MIDVSSLNDGRGESQGTVPTSVVGRDPKDWPGPTECPKCKPGDPFNIWNAGCKSYGACVEHRVFWHMGQPFGFVVFEESAETHGKLRGFVPATFEGDLASLPRCSASGGDCPYCGTSYYLNVRKNHWGYCHAHKVKWHIGYGLFSSWQYESDETWRQNWEQLEGYREVEPWLRDDPDPPTEPERCPTCHAVKTDFPF